MYDIKTVSSKAEYKEKLDTVIAEMEYLQNYQNEEHWAFYQIRSLLMEFKQEMEGGYLAVDYVEEKCQKIISVAKDIATRKGMYRK